MSRRQRRSGSSPDTASRRGSDYDPPKLIVHRPLPSRSSRRIGVAHRLAPGSSRRRGLALVFVGVLIATSGVATAAPSEQVRWSALRRPFHLPVMAPGSACPVSKIDRRLPWQRIGIFGGSGIGPGPVYPGLGSTSGLLNAVKDTQYGGPWQGQKVFWYVAPSYRARVLIRGRRLDGPGWLGFNGTRVPKDELRIEPYDTVSWSGQPRYSRGIPSGVRALTSGCYGAQIDGTTFSRTVVFTIDLAP